MMDTKTCRMPRKRTGIVAGRIEAINQKAGDFAEAAIAAEVKRLKKMVYTKSLATMLAHKRTVRDRIRADVLMISTGKIKGESHATGPAKCFRYPPRPWCLTPCQLK